MKKQLYFISGLAVMALALTASCSRDNEVYQPTKAEIMANAEERLGVSIDPALDWNMTSQGRACITINGNYGETYTVKIYSNDPLRDKKGYVLRRGEVKSGDMFISEFDYPAVNKWLVVGVTDSRGFTNYKPVRVDNGLLITTIGSPEVAGTRALRKSRTAPTVAQMTDIPTSEYAKSFLVDAKEPNDQNISEYWDGSPNYAKHFKITGTYDKIINVLPAEGANAHTVYVSGTWTLPAGEQYNWVEQRVGGSGVIVVDNGGEIVIPEYSMLTLANQARLVVMPGGKVSGKGTLLVTNGNDEGLEGYNGGEINIGKFNNNFGKFYNYGKLIATEYAAGAGESNIYNHGLVHIGGAGNQYYSEAANARIFNACQWYCDNDMRAFIVENTQGSYFYVGGELMMSDGTDGTGETSYVALASGALMRMGTLASNNCDWTGPTSGYAVVETGKVRFLSWTGDGPIERGYFANNIAITVDDKTNNCEGKSNENAYDVLTRYVADGKCTNGNTTEVGNGGVSFVEKFGASVTIPRDENFVAGVSGCTPGYQGIGGGVVEEQPTVTPDPDPETPTESNAGEDEPAVWTYAFEDTPQGDYDMNDVVIKVREIQTNGSADQLEVTLCCVGATFDLFVCLDDTRLFGKLEAHKVMGQPLGAITNTGVGEEVPIPEPTRIDKPAGFSFATADFWLDSPAVPGGVHIAKTGEDPHGVAIPADWQWPRESVGIKEAYPNFVKFAADVEKADEDARMWYKTTATNPVADKVFTPQLQ